MPSQLTLPTCSDSSHGIEMRQREAGMAGPPKAEPELTTSVAAALDSGSAHAAGGGDDDANSDSEELAAAEAFVDKLAARMSSRQRQRGRDGCCGGCLFFVGSMGLFLAL